MQEEELELKERTNKVRRQVEQLNAIKAKLDSH